MSEYKSIPFFAEDIPKRDFPFHVITNLRTEEAYTREEAVDGKLYILTINIRNARRALPDGTDNTNERFTQSMIESMTSSQVLSQLAVDSGLRFKKCNAAGKSTRGPAFDQFDPRFNRITAADLYCAVVFRAMSADAKKYVRLLKRGAEDSPDGGVMHNFVPNLTKSQLREHIGMVVYPAKAFPSNDEKTKTAQLEQTLDRYLNDCARTMSKSLVDRAVAEFTRVASDDPSQNVDISYKHTFRQVGFTRRILFIVCITAILVEIVRRLPWMVSFGLFCTLLGFGPDILEGLKGFVGKP